MSISISMGLWKPFLFFKRRKKAWALVLVWRVVWKEMSYWHRSHLVTVHFDCMSFNAYILARPHSTERPNKLSNIIIIHFAIKIRLKGCGVSSS
jgi:hypothetical protein